MQVQVDHDALRYHSYIAPYPRLSQINLIKASEIELVFAGYDGYQLLLRNGDVVLFPRTKEIALYEFVQANGIQTVVGTDPWNLLTEPYLDQTYTPEETHRTLERLGRLSFAPDEVEAIRTRVGPSLLAYNSLVWEWVSLGLVDVLKAQQPSNEDFYRWAISISKRGYQQATTGDLMEKRHQVGMDTILWSKFELLARRKDLWTTPPPFAAQNSVHKWLFQQYSEPHRHYHNIHHLEQVMSLLYSLPSASNAVLLAGLFHDCVYRSEASDNEEKSATQMDERMRPLNVNPSTLLKAKVLILYTRRHHDSTDTDERALHDADLGIFGLRHEAYARYAAGIRKEYAWAPDELFKKRRREILEEFLRHAQARGQFFYSLDPIFERQVETNLRWEINSYPLLTPI